MEQITVYLKMMRIPDWIKFYTLFPVAGAFLYCGISTDLIMVSAIFFCVIAYGFVINNYFDIEIDRKHTRKAGFDTNPLASNRITKRGTLLLSAVLVMVPALVSATMNSFGFFLTLLCILALTLYSAKPVRLKDRYFIDIIIHGVMFGGFPFLAGFTLAGGTDFLSLQLPVAIALLCSIVCCEALILHQIHDYEEDLIGSYTTVVRIGQRRGWLLLALAVLVSLIVLEFTASYFRIGWYLYLAIIALLILYPLYSSKQDIVAKMKSEAHKAGVFCLR
ncbi:UbiA family prenyltransferase [Methanoculleus sp.]|jgi:4-hydroxybenzoate polyprenyltransferase|uniref:UbiA prenyltransferase family protein n=1 Tax=Methanoculleus sp. TaxID=90427 RepID=UPI001BD23B75|nr:UbiA family prenyltransferase [Methanoculleus sp.]